MKKVVTLVIVVFMLVITTNYAAGQENVDVFVDEDLVNFPDQEPYIDENSRVQVPVRFVSEALGGYVEWDGSTQTVNIKLDKKELSLEVGQEIYLIDNSEKEMDTVPQVSQQGRTMVPLRFVSEGLGAEVDWLGEEESVYINTKESQEEKENENNENNPSDVPSQEELENSEAMAEIKASNLNVRTGPGMDYSVVDNLQAGDSFPILDKHHNENEEEYQDWLKIDLEDEQDDVWVSADFIEISFLEESEEDEDKEQKDEEKEEIEEPEEDERDRPEIPQEYDDILGEIVIDADNLNVRTGPGLDYDSITQVDEGEDYDIITMAAMENHPTYEEWFKIDLDKRNLDVEDRNEAKGWVAAEYVKRDNIDLMNNLEEINYINWTENSNNTEITLGPVQRIPLESFTREDPDRLVLDFEGIALATDETAWQVETSTLQGIRAHEHNGMTRVVFDLNSKEHYSIDWEDAHLNVRLYDDNPLSGKKIFIDPGHGGSNSGAIGQNGLKEKEVALDVSLRTRDMLEELGADIYMSRESDIQVSLDERVEMATDSNADIFVSVHANAHPNNDIHGTETFYSSERSPLDFELAEALQNSLLHSLQRNNRGVKDSSFRVLRNATMPAALVELAFLSHEKEEELLKKDEFREKAAEAIVEGILNYDKTVR
ncbi:N-acetylmuramoyl-L-alanine amidase [Natranaerobius thermophilus]|uniref:N-acetylmuramoyl-L-alanine amidase n=1 Tax=Natranaerobius thermophilus (strain ATCC BAA-1301 / DSM 18059 / JW/NM-WN-LF) TaxID=457570 RepID=B2A138_NATTJ|nr:N-acetylmuramoyl-L-alanine amidase [Natranaerobius thermophilus]ACB84661.1 N-acetylmuramoyl-L-alanine amidase [Natranaerobius thermophilus JW/NM-WN-LF]